MHCKIKSCLRETRSRGWCKPHYDAWVRTGDPTTYRGDRSNLSLWDKIKEIGWTRAENGCLEYNGFRNELGYGQIRSSGRLWRVHRIAYSELVGFLSIKEEVMHFCDNPACSEPVHLQKGTHLENMHDMLRKGRHNKASWTECPNGHNYPADRPKNIDKNRCRECARERNRRYYLRKKAVYGLAYQS